MNKVLRSLAGVGAVAAIALTAAGPANAAATTEVQIRNGAYGTDLLTAGAYGLLSMQPAGGANQTFTRTDLGAGWATLAQGDQCLTGMRLGISSGFAKLETCRRGDTMQIWRQGDSRELQVRESGLHAEAVDSALGVTLGHFAGRRTQKWGISPAA